MRRNCVDGFAILILLGFTGCASSAGAPAAGGDTDTSMKGGAAGSGAAGSAGAGGDPAMSSDPVGQDGSATPDDSAMSDASYAREAGSTPDGGATDSGAVASCSTYCAAVTANCTVDHKEYNDLPTCLAMCAKMEVGTAGDTSVNTLGCRMARATATAKDPTQCSAAGPFSAVCGASRCDNFCDLFVAFCGKNPVASFSSRAACMTNCQSHVMTFNPNKSDIDPTANSANCPQAHLENSVADPTHCSHLSIPGSRCL